MELLLNSKNLLAFSGGVDSTALFFKLLEQNIEFDIAMVDYGVRDQSKEEVAYAKELCTKYNKKIFLKEYDDIKFNEKFARDFRYEFFNEIIKEHSYDILITAHQLNDRLEWFLMQLTRGAGVSELMGFDHIEQRDNYKLVRPLLDKSKDELEEYLDKKGIKYFIDDTNCDTKIKRNYFRMKYSNKLIEEFKEGIINSFKYIQNDIHSLDNLSKLILKEKALSVYRYNGDKNIAIKVIDKELKHRGILISKATRDEILEQSEITVSAKICVAITNDKIWVSPYSNYGMLKEFKECCRVNKIPKNIRAYLSTLYKDCEEMKNSLHDLSVI